MIRDLTGQKFGRLEVLKDSGLRNRGNIIWLCKCECGSFKKIAGRNITSGKTQSCGCLSVEQARLTARRITEDSHKKAQLKLDKLFRKDGTAIPTLTQKKSKNNTSGFKGVQKRKNRYIARITFKGKDIYLGSFGDIKDAIAAREQAEEKYFKPILEKYKKTERGN